jgi:Trk K+ transport system NAD-binding subunit
MENIVFLVFRRMRTPLLWLTLVYSVAILGLVLIPGRDADGNVWHMDFFHALYFVSFMATTIGFGEIPYDFSDAQRLWVLFSIYATVVVWIYSIGTVLALLQDKTFQQAITERRFAKKIASLKERFYLICGYGETGSALIRALTERDQRAVALDILPDRVSMLQLENLRQYVPALCGDAGRPIHLREAGLCHPQCAGVVALTNVNEVNLKIAITAKLLRPEVKVICRADSHEVEDNMASFGTNHIFDPFDTFAHHMATALQAPCLYLLHEWLTGVDEQPLPEPVFPPRQGLWILCGYGRFGKAMYERLIDEEVEVVVVEANPERTGKPSSGRLVVGWGTEAVTLQEAHIERAVGIVAGTHHDVNNLSIIMTARDLKSDLFVVARENHIENHELFESVKADVVMHPSSVIANKIRVLLGMPLLSEFESLALYEEDAWACQLVSRIAAVVHEEVPEIWEVKIDSEQAYAVLPALERGAVLTLKNLCRNPRERKRLLPCVPLMLARGSSRQLLPPSETRLKSGDRLLFCGRHNAQASMEWTLQNVHLLNYILTGGSRPQGVAWRFMQRVFKRSH